MGGKKKPKHQRNQLFYSSSSHACHASTDGRMASTHGKHINKYYTNKKHITLELYVATYVQYSTVRTVCDDRWIDDGWMTNDGVDGKHHAMPAYNRGIRQDSLKSVEPNSATYYI